jgi:hypothetical protein
MQAIRCFLEQVVRKRPYLTLELCKVVLQRPLRMETQEDGRRRYWAMVTDPRDGRRRALRVVALDDGETIHNAFYDRDFEETQP